MYSRTITCLSRVVTSWKRNQAICFYVQEWMEIQNVCLWKLAFYRNAKLHVVQKIKTAYLVRQSTLYIGTYIANSNETVWTMAVSKQHINKCSLRRRDKIIDIRSKCHKSTFECQQLSRFKMWNIYAYCQRTEVVVIGFFIYSQTSFQGFFYHCGRFRNWKEIFLLENKIPAKKNQRGRRRGDEE